MLRKAIGGLETGKQLIRTIPRRGYRFEDSKDDPSRNFVLEHHVFEQTLIEDVTDRDAPLKPADAAPAALPASTRLVRPAHFAAMGCLVLLAVGLAAWQFSSREAVAAVAEGGDFASGGDRVTTAFDTKMAEVRATAVQRDGTIVVAGWTGESMASADFALARYNSDGSLDVSFGAEGKVTTAVGPQIDFISAVAIQPDDRIVVAGVSFTGTSTRRFCVARYKENGVLDPSFDGDGIVTATLGTKLMDTATAVAIQIDGKIIAAGSAYMLAEADGSQLGQNDFGLLRLNADGSVDESFGEKGKVITNFGSGGDIAYSVAVQSDGRIVAGGLSSNGTNQDSPSHATMPMARRTNRSAKTDG